MQIILTLIALALTVVQSDAARDALRLGRTSDQDLYNAFNAGYQLAPSGPVSKAEVITEFRRAVLIVRDHANQGEYAYSAQDLARAMAAHEGMVTFIVQTRLHPLHTYTTVPSYELYVETGETTKPLAAKPLKREPVYPPGGFGSGMTGVGLEGTFPRAGIEAAAAPTLVVLDDKADVVWKARIDLTRYR